MMDDSTVTEQPHEENQTESIPMEGSEHARLNHDVYDFTETSGKTNETDESEEGPQSSMENIIPLEKLKRGFFAMSGIISDAAQKVQTSAIDAYNSEQVRQIRQKTSEVVTPAWEKTVEVTKPVWEQTKVTTHAAYEKAKVGMHNASEQMKPTLDTVCTCISLLMILDCDELLPIFRCHLN